MRLVRHDYNPDALSGPKNQHPEQTGLAIDGNRNTAWTTEQYLGDSLGKPGVGIYVDAKPGVAARLDGDRHRHAGVRGHDLRNELPAQPGRRSTPDQTAGSRWAARRACTGRRRSSCSSTTKYRYYLVWITSLGGHSQVAVNEIALYTA